MAKEPGKLYVCATPIGNLEDITLRALRVLKEVDLIAAEDTRVTLKLLSRYEIATPMTSYHEHNEAFKTKELINQIRLGKQVALVSDAGMPGISDPGERLIRAAIDEGLDVEPIPGPSALITALVVSGLPTGSFVFQGFLPRKKGERNRLLRELLSQKRTVVLYESPRRVGATLSEAAEIDPQREAVVARELTKKFEETIRGSVSEILERLDNSELKGEIVLLFGPKPEEKREVSAGEIREIITDMLGKGMTKKQAISEVAKRCGISKRVAYGAVMDIHENNY